MQAIVIVVFQTESIKNLNMSFNMYVYDQLTGF